MNLPIEYLMDLLIRNLGYWTWGCTLLIGAPVLLMLLIRKPIWKRVFCVCFNLGLFGLWAYNTLLYWVMY